MPQHTHLQSPSWFVCWSDIFGFFCMIVFILSCISGPKRQLFIVISCAKWKYLVIFLAKTWALHIFSSRLKKKFDLLQLWSHFCPNSKQLSIEVVTRAGKQTSRLPRISCKTEANIHILTVCTNCPLWASVHTHRLLPCSISIHPTYFGALTLPVFLCNEALLLKF